MSGDLTEFRGVVRRFLADRAGHAVVPAPADAGAALDRGLWRAMAREMGLPGLLLPEHQGGSGAGLPDLAGVSRELGRVLAPVPFLSTVALALPILSRHGVAGEIAAVVSGEAVAAAALWATPSEVGAPGTAVRAAQRTGDLYALDGGSVCVLDGPEADLLVVLAAAPGGWTWFLVDARAPGVAWSSRPSMDLTRAWADLRLTGAPGRRLGVEGTGLATAREALGLARLMLAAECAGVAERCLELSVEHAMVRIQFGRPIGSFQAVKHRCARMLTEVALAGAMVDEAAANADLGSGATAALARAAAAAYRVAADTIQVHGGIGVTWEHPAQQFFKRAVGSRRILGSTDALRGELAAELAL